jgi:hypothetical protein
MRRLKLQERTHARCACSITWINWISKQELSPSCGGRNTCLYAFPNRAVSKRKRHPAWRLPPIAQLLLRCLNSGIHALAVCWQKEADIPAGLPSPTYRRAGTRLARRAIVARTQCAAAPRLRRFRATPHTPFSPFSVPSKRRRSTDSLSTSDPMQPVTTVCFRGD